MFYLAEKPSKFGHQFDRWIFVPLSPDARKFIQEHPIVREGKGVNVDKESTLWEFDWAAATDIIQDALNHRLKVVTPDKLNYLKAILK
jgi:hypothetical protein